MSIFGAGYFDRSPGSCPRRRVWSQVLVMLVLIAIFWPTGGNSLFHLLWDIWQPEDRTPLELPAELVVAKVPPAVDWFPDEDRRAIYLASGADPMGFADPKEMQRLDPPWKEPRPVPFPADYDRMGGGPVCNTQFVARGGLNKDFHATVDIISRKTAKVVAHVEPYATFPNRHNAVWHPRMNVLVWGAQGYVMLLGEPDWQPKLLTTAARDYEEWSRLAAQGKEESGYHPTEGLSQPRFNDDGSLLICAMDRGLRVYSWPEVLAARSQLPAAKFSFEGELVEVNRFATFKNTYALEYDPARARILWAGMEGKIFYFDVTTKTRGVLLALPKPFLVQRMEFLGGRKVLCCEVCRIGTRTWTSEGLYLLDYTKLSQQGKALP